MQTIELNVFYPTKPHAKQKEVLAALDSGQRFIQLRAGRKFRKTSLLVSWLFEKAFETGLTCPYVAPNRVQAKNIVWDDHVQRMLEMFALKGMSYKKNEVELSVKLPNGGKVQLLGIENKEALRGISNWGAFAGDEYDDWEEDIWPTIIRPNLVPHKAPAILAGTPKGFSNLFRLEKNPEFKSFHFSSYDNPDLDRDELASLEREYKEMGMAYYRQEILAEYEKPVGTVYAEWDMDKQFIPFWYNNDLPLHLAWDFGVNDPTAILFLQPNGSEIRLVDYYEASDANIEHFAKWIKDRGYKKPSFEAGDIAGRARSVVTGKSPIDELRKYDHHVISRSIPDIEQQIRTAHRYIPKLYISSSNKRCERFRDILLNYRYPTKPENSINQDNENPIHNEWSHGARAFEYYCWNYSVGTVGGVEQLGQKKLKEKFFTAKIDPSNGSQIGIDPDKFAAIFEK